MPHLQEGNSKGNGYQVKKCPDCDVVPRDRISWNNHKQVHKERSFKCRLCDYRSRFGRDVKLHVQAKHEKQKVFACRLPGCDYRTAWPGCLKLHLRAHSDEKPFACDHGGCSFRTKIQANLKRHQKRVHSDEKPIACQHTGCMYRTSYEEALKRHLAQVHSDERPFPCPHSDCSYRSKVKSLLNSHYKHAHSDERPISCKHAGCGYRAVSKSAVRCHAQRVHLKLRNWSCHVCQKSFFGRFTLRKHVATHARSGHNAKDCDLCEDFKEVGGEKTSVPSQQSGKLQNLNQTSVTHDQLLGDETQLTNVEESLNKHLIDIHISMQLLTLI